MWRVRTFESGSLGLDGGAMFGSVPRPLWERLIPPDAQHRIPLAMRLLLLEEVDGDRLVLVDGGIGDKEDMTFRERFCVVSDPLRVALHAASIDPDQITDVVITHLHFDHAGGLTSREGDRVVPVLPKARHWLQRRNHDNCNDPNPRERASYLRENLDPLREVELELLDGEEEIFPGVRVEPSDGHTDGMQTVRVEGGGEVIRYLADLAPTHHHVRLPFCMGYDMCAKTVLAEKARMVAAARDEGAILLFEHDPHFAAGRLIEKKGRWVAEPLSE